MGIRESSILPWRGSTPASVYMSYDPYAENYFADPVFKPGAILVVTEKPDVTFVTIEKNLGSVAGVGWLLKTKEGNHVIVRTVEEKATTYLQRVIFITDPDTFTELLDKLIDAKL